MQQSFNAVYCLNSLALKNSMYQSSIFGKVFKTLEY